MDLLRVVLVSRRSDVLTTGAPSQLFNSSLPRPMILVNQSTSSSARPLALAMRPDLQIRGMRMRGRMVWVVKDPVAMRYYQLREEEYFGAGGSMG